MCARPALSGPPHRLLGDRIVFTNWHFVHQGLARWRNRDGQDVTVVGQEGPHDAELRAVGLHPTGIRLKAYAAQPTGPLLHLEEPWEQGGAIGTLLQEEGRYRAWLATGWGDLEIFAPGVRPNHLVSYMESTDGFSWEKPHCGLIDFEGSTRNNIVFETSAFIGGGCSVFQDPSADPSEAYKLVAEWNRWDPETVARYERRWPTDVDARAKRQDVELCLGPLGAVSPDGLQWTVLPDPLAITHCDTQLVAGFNSHLNEYVLYTRDYVDLPFSQSPAQYDCLRMVTYARRAVGAMRSKDFRHFSLPQIVLQADLSMRPSEVLYTNCYTTIPGAPEHHLMFPTVWDLCRHDETWIAAASSHDGLCWQYLPGGPVLGTGRFGAWDGGCVYMHPNMVELPNGDWAMPYTGFNVPHKYPRVLAKRNTGYAVWPRGRFVSIQADETGQFETIPVIPNGDVLCVNAVTRRAGCVRVEVCVGSAVVPGREMDRSVPICGEQHWTRVCWKEHDRLGIGSGKPVVLRFQLNQAEIFGLEFRRS